MYEYRKRESGFTQATNSYWPQGGTPMSCVSWLVTTIIELILFIMVAWKANYQFCSFSRSKPVSKTPDIMSIIARDSMIYFAV